MADIKQLKCTKNDSKQYLLLINLLLGFFIAGVLHEHIRLAQSVQDYLRHSINPINSICSYDEVFQQVYRQKAVKLV